MGIRNGPSGPVRKWREKKSEGLPSVELFVLEGLALLQKYKNVPGNADRHAIESESWRLRAINSFKMALEHADMRGTPGSKVEPNLFLMQLYEGMEYLREDLESAFYDAVESAIQASAPNPPEFSVRNKIVSAYLSNLDPQAKAIFDGNESEAAISFVWSLIDSKSRERILNRTIEESRNVKEFVASSSVSRNVFEKIQSVLRWYARILIISETSGEVLLRHNFTDEEVAELRKLRHASLESPNNPSFVSLGRSVAQSNVSPTLVGKTMTVEVFNRPGEYRVYLDRGPNSSFGFDPHYLSDVFWPLADSYIRHKERDSYSSINGFSHRLAELEARMRLPSEKSDYRSFIRKSLDSLDVTEYRRYLTDPHFIDDFQVAVDICRFVTSRHVKGGLTRSRNSFASVDRMLEGKVNRRILGLVRTMILSRNETMNGLGHPFGLTKKHVPLEGRLYTLIRAYEILWHDNPITVLDIMKQWAADGYFDSHLLGIFASGLENETFPRKAKYPKPVALSEYRVKRYAPYLDQWSRLFEMTQRIGEEYQRGRWNQNDSPIRLASLKRANEMHSEILAIADTKKLIYVTRHGETLSDDVDGFPWQKDELITEQGEMTCLAKAEAFSWVSFRIFSSPLIRARQSAAIICQRVSACVLDIVPRYTPTGGLTMGCVGCSGVSAEESITNPEKNIENGRYNSPLRKVTTDNPDALHAFLTLLVSSPEETTNLIVAHRDSGRNAMIWLKNLFSKISITGWKIPMENSTVYELHFRGNEVVSDGSNLEKGFFFRIDNWKTVLAELNEISKQVFGRSFHEISSEEIDLIRLHDLFLDFLDVFRDGNPELFDKFLERLADNPHAGYLVRLLKKEKNGGVPWIS